MMILLIQLKSKHRGRNVHKSCHSTSINLHTHISTTDIDALARWQNDLFIL